jgi:hypothetical protein
VSGFLQDALPKVMGLPYKQQSSKRGLGRFPMTLQVERRAVQRTAITTQALVVPEGCVEGDPAEVVNVSLQGVRITVVPPVSVGQRIKLLLKGRENAWCSVPCRVTAVDEQGASLTFLRVDPAAQVILDSLFEPVALAEPTGPASAPRKGSSVSDLDPYVTPVGQRRQETPTRPLPALTRPAAPAKPEGAASGALLQRLRDLRQ